MLTDMHYAVLELLKAGHPLSTRRTQSRTTAMIGSKRIAVPIVADLESAKMIRCYRQDDHVAYQGAVRHFEFVKDSPDPVQVSEPASGRHARLSRDDARRAVMAAWCAWWSIHEASGKPRSDADIHAFLKELRAEHPQLFRSSVKNPYERAFSWVLETDIHSTETV